MGEFRYMVSWKWTDLTGRSIWCGPGMWGAEYADLPDMMTHDAALEVINRHRKPRVGAGMQQGRYKMERYSRAQAEHFDAHGWCN